MQSLPVEHWSFYELLEFFGSRILFAVLCGGLIGIERELKHKVAGLKTNILICVGAALYTAISVTISSQHASHGYYGDPGRLAAQIVSGVGFLGGGAILHSKGTIFGLTTAATIWVVAAIGLTVGIGRADIAIGVTLIVLIVLTMTSYFEDKILGRMVTFSSEILLSDPEGTTRLKVNELLEKNDLFLDDFDLIQQGKLTQINLRFKGHRDNNKKFILSLWGLPGVKEVKQL